MPDLNEIAVEWTTPAGTNGRSIFYFGAGVADIAQQRAALAAFLAAYIPYCADTVHYTVPTTGRVIQDITGAHTGDWFEATVYTGVGTQTSGPVPDVAQVLTRWRTDLFTNGRRLQGRSFLPGLSRANVEGGNVAAGVVTAVSAAAQGLVTSATGFSIWSRPQTTRAGLSRQVETGTCWTEMATQRRRRG